eukprot:scaffold8443_cov157-Isochrysis_galbana.AAC.2
MSGKKERGECINCVTPWGLRPRTSSQYNVLGGFIPDEVISLRVCALRRTRSNHVLRSTSTAPSGMLVPVEVGLLVVRAGEVASELLSQYLWAPVWRLYAKSARAI